jgi:toxin secretion/phage lysis holin
MEDVKKWLISLILGAWATFTQQYAIILGFIITVIILDFITGLIKAYTTGVGWKSSKGFKGFWKKVSLLVAFNFGIFLDFFIPYALKIISIELPFNSPFALIVGCYIIINESISICENLYRINPHSLPRWIVALLKGANDKINKN